ncbi:hypothetical protein CSOJ01_10037 [Colletotrichum sojae]|uniref:Uncharacterized protein n=1 Tax=Colletotrichum sojae TaxID=2175907 RepID=A0A8H6J217_9PEZI|nr:hypothetical protein CSOJ01_10037 [Colletotrichum sojae]
MEEDGGRGRRVVEGSERSFGSRHLEQHRSSNIDEAAAGLEVLVGVGMTLPQAVWVKHHGKRTVAICESANSTLAHYFNPLFGAGEIDSRGLQLQVAWGASVVLRASVRVLPQTLLVQHEAPYRRF